MKKLINEEKSSFQMNTNKSLYYKFKKHFEYLFTLNSYFNKKIDSKILFIINGEQIGNCCNY